MDAFRRVGEGVMRIGEVLQDLRQRGKRGRKPPRRPEIPKPLQAFFRRHRAGWPEYVILKIQLVILILFGGTVIHLVLFPGRGAMFVPILLILSAYAIYLTSKELKPAFGRDYPAYRSFTSICVGIAWIFILAFKYLPPIAPESIHLIVIRSLGVLGLVLSLFLVFRMKYGRNYTYGWVEKSSGKSAIVRVGYDIRSNVRSGTYLVENLAGAKAGDRVKLIVERPMFGLRGSKVRAISEKLKR